MKPTSMIKLLLVLLTCMLLMSPKLPSVFGAKPYSAPVSEGAPEVAMGIELKPPPNEALTVPKYEAPAPLPYTPLLLTAVVLIALSAIICVKKVKVKRIFPLATMFAVVLLAPCLSGVVYAAHDFGNPLDTSNIMLFAYYYDSSGWTLANTVPAFESYTDHGNYYDGIVRVWMDQKADNNFIGSDFYVDVRVRVRADGWILAWLTTDQSYAYIVFWGHSKGTAGAPVIGATVPSRAIQRVYYASGRTFPGHNAINYWDFTHPTANKLLIFGKTNKFSYPASTVYFYYTIPASVQIVDSASSISYYETYSYDAGKIYVDGAVFADLTSTCNWYSLSLLNTALTKEIKHTVALWSSLHTGEYSYINFAIILWLQ